MKRRSLLGLMALSPACSVVGSSKARVVQAGPFTVSVPAAAGKTLVEHVPLHPLYKPEAWKRVNAKDGMVHSLKPGYNNRPEHWAVRFPKLARRGQAYDAKTAGDEESAPQILIHRYREWPVVFTDGKDPSREFAKRTVAEELRDLEAFYKRGIIHPSLAFVDAGFSFASLKRKLNFQGGRGLRCVGQWTIEPDLLSNSRLHYLFCGFSQDGSTHVLATFPLNVPGLPDDDTINPTHLGRSTKNYADLSKNFRSYEKEARAWIEAREAQLQPSLAMLDGMIESLTGSWA